MSDPVGNHIVGFPTRRLIYFFFRILILILIIAALNSLLFPSEGVKFIRRSPQELYRKLNSDDTVDFQVNVMIVSKTKTYLRNNFWSY